MFVREREARDAGLLREEALFWWVQPCTAVSPNTGDRCVLRAGHQGQHIGPFHEGESPP